jgi:signal transduction histidine kinase
MIGSVIGLYDVRSKRRDDRVVALHESAQSLLEAESKEDASRVVIEALTALLDLEISAIWLVEDGKLAPAASTDRSREVFNEIPVFEAGNSLAWQVFEDQEARVFTDVGTHPDRYNEETTVSTELMIPLGRHGIMICGSLQRQAFQRYQRELSHILASYTELVFDRIEQREDLQQREETLERQNKRLEEFASVVSHDLQSPLSVITGSVELARDGASAEHFTRIENAAARMQTLIEDLLSLARSGDRVNEVAPVDLGAVAMEAWANVQSESVSLEVADDVGEIRADRSRLKQLLENLFTNSLEHGGDVTVVRVERVDGGFVLEDDGAGIPDDIRSEIFEFGYTNAESGSGLGLAIVREIAEGHGWTVAVEDGAEGGARFVIRTS